jgi:hypothetical protein
MVVVTARMTSGGSVIAGVRVFASVMFHVRLPYLLRLVAVHEALISERL